VSRERVVVVGDLVNDIVATPRGEVRPDTDTTSSIRPRPGGSAANTAAWLGSLGVPTDFVGAAGSQDAESHRRILAEHGVTAHLQIEYGVPTGTIVIIVQGESRTMLTERGANALLDTERVTDDLLGSARMLHLSAYSFLDGFGLPGARELVARARAAGVPVAVNPGSAGYIADFGPERFLEAVEGADILFPNVAEGRLLTGESDPERILGALGERFPIVVLTRGSAGASGRVRGGATVSVPAPSVRLVDPTGAGDAFAAGFLQRWLVDEALEPALETGAHVAARAVLAIGGRPPV
jgi:sugar/nucleoside kinase (ribokinase family)